MREDEVLLIGHRELVEIYISYMTNMFYYWMSALILNGALASLGGLLWSSELLYSVGTAFTYLVFLVAIFGNSLFVLHASRTKAIVTTLVNRIVTIEDSLQERGVTLDTFRSSISLVRKGMTLVNGKRDYKKLRLWERLSFFCNVHILIFFIISIWISMAIIIFTTLY